MSVFISHSLKDKEIYTRVCQELKANDITCENLPSEISERLSDQLRRAIQECDLCVFLATRNSVRSSWCGAELGAFWGAGKRVMVLMCDPEVQQELQPQFRDDLSATTVAEVVTAIKKRGLLKPASTPAALFYFEGAGASGRDRDKVEVIRAAVQPDGANPATGAVNGWNQIGQLETIDGDGLRRFRGLFLAMPFHSRLSEHLINRLVHWVREGGNNLVIAGFELGERHHGTNINQLGYHFGLSLDSNVIVGAETEGDRDKNYNTPLSYDKIEQPSQPLFEDVTKIVMQNACSLRLEPGAMPLVSVSPNRIRELDREAAEYGDGLVLAAGDQRFQPPAPPESRAVMALAPRGLTGKGRVLAMGTWDFRSEGRSRERTPYTLENDNTPFLRNLARWLVE